VAATSCQPPLILCGDLNARQPQRTGLSEFREVRRCWPLPGWTFSTRIRCADHIFVSDDIHVRHVEVPRTHLTRLASDHFPLIADLELA
jgi:endonuclease/exonuclease/phosphatase family metal-dependent hydrolase